jgi:hypothetical protein
MSLTKPFEIQNFKSLPGGRGRGDDTYWKKYALNVNDLQNDTPLKIIFFSDTGGKVIGYLLSVISFG